MRKESCATRYPGVSRIGPNLYRVRAKVIDLRTGKVKEIDREETAASPKEAAAIREELRRQAEGLVAGDEPATRQRLADAATSWLESKALALKSSTRRLYADTIDLHIAPSLGDLYVDAITPDDIVAWRSSQKGSPHTISGRLRILKRLLSDVCYELQLRNPAERVSAIRTPRPTQPKGLEAHELRSALKQLRIHEPNWYPIGLTLALTGARWGEIAALKWSDLNERAGTITIERAHVRSTRPRPT